MQKTKIEWCDYTWNPVTGCKRGCSYCYARRIHERFYKSPFSEIVFHPERLADPARVKAPSRIFVGSMSDVQYWNPEWIAQILDVCERCPHHTFMFLTKEVGSYVWFEGRHPSNCMFGLTLTETMSQDSHEQAIYLADYPRPFLSLEPLLGPLDFRLPRRIELVIVGAMTGPGAIVPKEEWVQSIVRWVPEKKLFWKDSMKSLIFMKGTSVGKSSCL